MKNQLQRLSSYLLPTLMLLAMAGCAHNPSPGPQTQTPFIVVSPTPPAQGGSNDWTRNTADQIVIAVVFNRDFDPSTVVPGKTVILDTPGDLWSHGSGADVMKRIATPMIGGVIASTIMELPVYPAIHYL